MRYSYRVPAAQLARYDVTRGPVTLRTSGAATLRRNIERVDFVDGPTVDLRDASYLAASSEAPEVVEALRMAHLREVAARILREATVHPAGTARLTAGDGRSYAPTIGFLTGLLGGGLITAGMCAGFGNGQSGLCLTQGLIGVLPASLITWGVGALVGLGLTNPPLPAQLVDPTPLGAPPLP
jgi:hypothetical protein